MSTISALGASDGQRVVRDHRALPPDVLQRGMAAVQEHPAANQQDSAGTDPDEHAMPFVLASLAKPGIDRSDQVPQRVIPELVALADVVVGLRPALTLLPHPRLPKVVTTRPCRGWDQVRSAGRACHLQSG